MLFLPLPDVGGDSCFCHYVPLNEGKKKGSNTRLLRGAQLLWCRPKLTKIHVVRKEEKGKLMKGREAKHEFQLAFAGNCFQRSIRFNSGVYPT